MPTPWSVVIEESGPCGTVIYREAAGTIACPWEFSGGEAVAAVRVGTEAEWLRSHPWAAGRRGEILERIAAEVIRQKAPSCRTQLDASGGWLSILSGRDAAAPGRIVPPPTPEPIRTLPPPTFGHAAAQAEAVRFVRRFRRLRMLVGLFVCLAAMVVGAGWWAATSVLSIGSTMSRFGESVRSGVTIATLVHRLEPSMPTLHRDGSKDRFTVGVLLHTADGSQPPRYVEIARGMTSTEMLNSRLLGADAQRIWFRSADHGAIDVATARVLSAADYARVQSLAPQPTGRITDLATGERALELHLAAGGLVTPTTFLLAADDTTAKRDFKPGGSTRPIVDVEPSKGPSLVFTADVDDSGDPDITDITGATADVTRRRIRLKALVAQPNPPVFHASLLRDARAGSLLVLPAQSTATPPLAPGVLRIHWTSQYRSGTVHLSRLDPTGVAVWERDLGLARLEEILPDPQRPAFIGTLPAPSGTLPEPVLVVVDAATGAVTTHSLVLR